MKMGSLYYNVVLRTYADIIGKATRKEQEVQKEDTKIWRIKFVPNYHLVLVDNAMNFTKNIQKRNSPIKTPKLLRTTFHAGIHLCRPRGNPIYNWGCMANICAWRGSED
jgi:hypothetical protein